MRMQIQAWCAAVGLALLAGSSVVAHHSASAYNLDKSVTLETTVHEIIFTNPHVMLHFDASTPTGEIQHWSIETYNPAVMKRAGWAKTTLKAGDKVTITFHAAINGTTNGYIRNGDGKIVFNGKQLNLDQTAGNSPGEP